MNFFCLKVQVESFNAADSIDDKSLFVLLFWLDEDPKPACVIKETVATQQQRNKCHASGINLKKNVSFVSIFYIFSFSFRTDLLIY